MTEQEINNIPVFVEELKKMANAVYMACDAEVAADIALKTQNAIKLIARLDEENQKLIPVVVECREILEHLKLIEPGGAIPSALIRQAK